MLHPDHVHAAVPPPKALDKRAKFANSKSAVGFDPHAIAVDTTEELTRLLPRSSDLAVARFIAKGGPVFVPFFDPPVLAALNEALRFLEQGIRPTPGSATTQWIEKLRMSGRLDPLLEVVQASCTKHAPGPVVVAPMCPPSSTDANNTRAPICITWLRGWPHMAKPGGVRLTFVPSLQPIPKASATGLQAIERYEAERQRSFGRVLLMAKGEYNKIRLDPKLKQPIAGGAVHSHPEQEEQMHRDYDRRAYASITELEAYDDLTREMNARASAALRSQVLA